jgi:hypothetical protein
MPHNGSEHVYDVGRTKKGAAMTAVGTHAEVTVLDRDEGLKMIDELARKTLNMSGSEFIAAWDAGKFDAAPDRPEIIDLVMLLPFAR